MLLFVGTYTDANQFIPEARGKGIYVFEVDDKKGTMIRKESATIDAGLNPCYIALSNNGKWLYAINEGTTAGESCVMGFQIEADGSSKKIGQWGVSGSGPCHVSVSHDDALVWVACYHSGSMTCYTVDQEDGSLMLNYFEKFQAASQVNPTRQEAPHAHACEPSLCEKWAYVTNLGGDRFYKYRIDAEQHLSKPTESSTWIALAPGSGPRHICLNPSMPNMMYVLCELSNEIVVCRKSPHGCIEQIQIIRTLPKDFNGESWAADIHCTPDGKFLYASNRGHDSLAGFQINATFGTLSFVGHTPTKGHFPRNFCIHPTGAAIFVANQMSDNIVMFWLDAETGKLTPSGLEVPCPTPVCLKMLPTDEMRKNKEKEVDKFKLNVASHRALRKTSV